MDNSAILSLFAPLASSSVASAQHPSVSPHRDTPGAAVPRQ